MFLQVSVALLGRGLWSPMEAAPPECRTTTPPPLDNQKCVFCVEKDIFYILKTILITRMHSSRMRIVHFGGHH